MAAVTLSGSACPPQHARDCEEIHRAWGELGKNEDKLIQILSRRSAIERKQIRETYAAMYSEDFLKRLQRELRGIEVEKCMYLWMHDPAERDAVIARDAFENWCTKYKALTEILCSRKSSELLLIKQAYYNKFKRHFDEDIASETTGSHRKILLALATAHRSHSKDVDMHIAKCDAKRLYEAGEGRVGTDESVIIEIFSKRSIPQLRATFLCYKQIYGHDITKAFKKETSGEFEDALRVTIKCLYCPPKYFAKVCVQATVCVLFTVSIVLAMGLNLWNSLGGKERKGKVLYTTVKGPSTDDSALSRVMVTRAENDMQEIKKEFAERYGMSVENVIREKTTAAPQYRSFLLTLANRGAP